MLKILAFVHAYHGHGRNAGAESTLHDMLRALVREGWQADVLLSRESDNVPPEGYVIDGVTVHAYTDKRQIERMVVDCDILITHLECSTRSTFIAKAAGKPLVQLVHNSLWQTEGYLAAGTDFAVYNSDWIADHHESIKHNPVVMELAEDNSFGAFVTRQCFEWDSCVLHPLVNPDDYRVNTHGDHVTLVNLFANKGPHIFYELARRFPEQKFLAVMGGYGKQETEWGLDNVTHISNKKDMREIYRKTKVVLMPSKYESYGRIAVEAAASGIPSVVTGTPGLREALGDAGNFVDNREDIDDWERKLRLLLTDASYYREASDACTTRSAELWTRSQEELREFVAAMTALALTRSS